MVADREEAARNAEQSTTNIKGMCQQWTRQQFEADSVGDYDGDGRADAEDGWKSEPAQFRHPGDRNPPRGVPVSYGGGPNDDGHRAVSLGNGKIRSTDAGGAGRVATVDLSFPEREWGLPYLGWSDTISGQLIPKNPPPPPVQVDEDDLTRGWRIDRAIELLKNARRHPQARNRKIGVALAALESIKQKPKK